MQPLPTSPLLQLNVWSKTTWCAWCSVDSVSSRSVPVPDGSRWVQMGPIWPEAWCWKGGARCLSSRPKCSNFWRFANGSEVDTWQKRGEKYRNVKWCVICLCSWHMKSYTKWRCFPPVLAAELKFCRQHCCEMWRNSLKVAKRGADSYSQNFLGLVSFLLIWFMYPCVLLKVRQLCLSCASGNVPEASVSRVWLDFKAAFTVEHV